MEAKSARSLNFKIAEETYDSGFCMQVVFGEFNSVKNRLCFPCKVTSSQLPENAMLTPSTKSKSSEGLIIKDIMQ